VATKKATRGKTLKAGKKIEQKKPLTTSDFSITKGIDPTSPK